MTEIQDQNPIYQANLKGRKLLKAALRAGNLNGESTYAQVMYLRDIHEQNLYFEFGYTSLMAFTRAIWDWSERKTKEMLEIAHVIHEFPKLCQAFREGRLCWTKARLLLRTLSQINDEEARLGADNKWSQLIQKPYLELELLLAREYCSKDPDEVAMEYLIRTQWVAGNLDEGLPGGKVRISFELPPDLYFLWEKAVDQTKKELYEASPSKDMKPNVAYHEVIGALARRVLSGKAPATKVVAPAEITLQHCETCEKTTIHSPHLGSIPLSKAQERMLTDSRHIPQGIYKKVLQRNNHHCAIPDCRNHLWLHLHHIKPFANGGSHEEENLVTLCDTHHRLLHDGKIYITHENGKLVFQDQFGKEMGVAHMSTYWPKALNLQTLVSLPTKRDRQVAAAIKSDIWEEKEGPDANISRETAAKRRIKIAIDDFYREQVERRKDLIPGFRRYEELIATLQ